MATNFQTIVTGNDHLDRIQANIRNALNAQATAVATQQQQQLKQSTPVGGPSYTVIRQSTPLGAIRQMPALFLVGPDTIPGGGGGIGVVLPDATAYSGQSFLFKRTDTSTIAITFFTVITASTGVRQLIDGSTQYSDTTSLGHGNIASDGQNWWVA